MPRKMQARWKTTYQPRPTWRLLPGGSGGDEDLLSSLASDVKHVKKEQDLSLLRELKDFRAPAAEIEKELGGMYERMNLAQQTKKKDPSATKGIK